MHILQVYTIAAGGFFLALVVFRGSSVINDFLEWLRIFLSKYLLHTFLLRRVGRIGPWTPADVLWQLLYVAINVFVLVFQAESFDEVTARGGTLTIVNMAPLFFGLHHGFLADLLGISLQTYQRLHRATGSMSCGLVVLYTVGIIRRSLWSTLEASNNLSLIVVSS